MVIAPSSDPSFSELGAIPWLILYIVGAEPGPTYSARLAKSTFIQRLKTSGGITSSTGCTQSTDVGHRVFVLYTVDYFCYKPAASEEDAEVELEWNKIFRPHSRASS